MLARLLWSISGNQLELGLGRVSEGGEYALSGVSRVDFENLPGGLPGGESYALLIFDNILPGLSGLELARRARSLAHRRHTPVVIVSASEVRAEAVAAGADVYLRKPQDVGLLVGTVKGLVGR